MQPEKQTSTSVPGVRSRKRCGALLAHSAAALQIAFGIFPREAQSVETSIAGNKSELRNQDAVNFALKP